MFFLVSCLLLPWKKRKKKSVILLSLFVLALKPRQTLFVALPSIMPLKTKRFSCFELRSFGSCLTLLKMVNTVARKTSIWCGWKYFLRATNVATLWSKTVSLSKRKIYNSSELFWLGNIFDSFCIARFVALRTLKTSAALISWVSVYRSCLNIDLIMFFAVATFLRFHSVWGAASAQLTFSAAVQ